jgi:hypothetical protein
MKLSFSTVAAVLRRQVTDPSADHAFPLASPLPAHFWLIAEKWPTAACIVLSEIRSRPKRTESSRETQRLSVRPRITREPRHRTPKAREHDGRNVAGCWVRSESGGADCRLGRLAHRSGISEAAVTRVVRPASGGVACAMRAEARMLSAGVFRGAGPNGPKTRYENRVRTAHTAKQNRGQSAANRRFDG